MGEKLTRKTPFLFDNDSTQFFFSISLSHALKKRSEFFFPKGPPKHAKKIIYRANKCKKRKNPRQKLLTGIQKFTQIM